MAHPDTAWNALFQAYGNLSGRVERRRRRTVAAAAGRQHRLVFRRHLSRADLSRRNPLAATTGMAHNSAVLYRDGHLGPTYARRPAFGGYNGTADYTWVAPPPPYPADAL